MGAAAMATGYELDELDPTLELEAELGIDTVKQAEILGELREAYALPESTTFELALKPSTTLLPCSLHKVR